ncbi:MAG: aspartate ammonia-lyase, partial [bacterium]|nr:aspartate ammonia-lyase [bacterium]
MADRIERDGLGEISLPADVYYGIHTARALENFNLAGRRVHPELITAMGAVKLACARVNAGLGLWPEDKAAAIEAACREMSAGSLSAHVVVDALQGGAGTSTNMNVNEVIANRALELLGLSRGSYDIIDPLDDINRHQSTNDVYPTALRVAAIRLLRRLEKAAQELQENLQAKERQFADVVKVGRTELMDAVLVTLGREFAAWAEAVARDRWRVFKCEERLRVVPLGGTAVGTGVTAPRRYIFAVTDELRSITGLGLARAENLMDAVQNADSFVEVSGILKAQAANLIKISSDMRLLASGPEAGIGEILLPPVQAGSSIMPGKVNPVICEAAGQAGIQAMACDLALTQAAASGQLELNQYMPLIADSLLTMLDLLVRASVMLARRAVNGIEADQERCRSQVNGSTATLTALLPEIGYSKACRLAEKMLRDGTGARQAVLEAGLMTEERFDELTSPEAV